MKNFECANCGRTYKHYSSLYKHIKWVCGVEPQFHCEHCNYKGNQKGQLKYHMLARHNLVLKNDK